MVCRVHAANRARQSVQSLAGGLLKFHWRLTKVPYDRLAERLIHCVHSTRCALSADGVESVCARHHLALKFERQYAAHICELNERGDLNRNSSQKVHI